MKLADDNDRRLLWLSAAEYQRLVAEARRRGVTPSRLLEQALANTAVRS